jgi:mycofactocin precursor
MTTAVVVMFTPDMLRPDRDGTLVARIVAGDDQDALHQPPGPPGAGRRRGLLGLSLDSRRGYAANMEEQREVEVVVEAEAVPSADLLEEELLVEEISIDGMCGVY